MLATERLWCAGDNWNRQRQPPRLPASQPGRADTNRWNSGGAAWNAGAEDHFGPRGGSWEGEPSCCKHCARKTTLVMHPQDGQMGIGKSWGCHAEFDSKCRLFDKASNNAGDCQSKMPQPMPQCWSLGLDWQSLPKHSQSSVLCPLFSLCQMSMMYSLQCNVCKPNHGMCESQIMECVWSGPPRISGLAEVHGRDAPGAGRGKGFTHFGRGRGLGRGTSSLYYIFF